MTKQQRPAGWRTRSERPDGPGRSSREEAWGATDEAGRLAADLDLDELAERAELRAGAWRRARGL